MRNTMLLWFVLIMFVSLQCWVVLVVSHEGLRFLTKTISVLIVGSYLISTSVSVSHAEVHEKAEAAIPGTTMSPPEGNTTFLGGTTWCVALPGTTNADLQNALDWACGIGKADCSPIQLGGLCFNPNTLLSHASYAFNIYYQQNGNSDIACNFGGTARIITRNPSHGKCNYLASGLASSASTIPQHIQLGKQLSRSLLVHLLLMFLGW